MDLRIFIEPQQGADYDDQLRVARTAEDAGYDAFFRSDHFLAMGEASGEPGPTDSWLTLAGLARETSTIRLGTLVTSATFRLPGPLAIAVAQVDRMSGGRVELGLGAGWFEAEHTAYGIPFPGVGERFDRLTEQLEIITGLWRTLPGERFDYAGAHYTLTDSPALPKPVQQPAPPVIVGGTREAAHPDAGRPVRRRVQRRRSCRPTRPPRQFERVGGACREIGRDPAELVRSTAQPIAVGRDDDEVARRALTIGRDVADLKANGLAGTAGRGGGPAGPVAGARPGSPGSTCSCWTWPTWTRSS